MKRLMLINLFIIFELIFDEKMKNTKVGRRKKGIYP
jgi:hypothetical protein